MCDALSALWGVFFIAVGSSDWLHSHTQIVSVDNMFCIAPCVVAAKSIKWCHVA